MHRWAWLLLFGLLPCFNSCERETTIGVSPPKEFRNLISPDTKAILNVDFDGLKKSSLWQAYQNKLDLARFGTMTSEIGLDPKRDIAHLLVAWDGKNILLLVSGVFDQAKIKNKLTAVNIPHREVGAIQVYGEGNNSFAFINPNLLVGGSSTNVEAAVGRTRVGSAPEELKERMKAVPAQDQLWVVSRAGLPFAEFPLRSDYQSLLSNIVANVSDTSLGIGIDSGIQLRGRIECNSAQGAQRVHDALRGAIGFGRLSTPDNKPQLLRAYDALHVDKAEQAVNLSANLPRELADQLIGPLIK
jgi:hypothetical protein